MSAEKMKRYDTPLYSMVEKYDGDYVKYADLTALRAENDRLKADNDVWRDKYAMIQDDLAKAWDDKRELVEALEKLIQRIDINGGLGEYKGGPAFVLCFARSIVAKHKDRTE